MLVLDEALLHEVLVADLHLAIGNIVGDKLGRFKIYKFGIKAHVFPESVFPREFHL